MTTSDTEITGDNWNYGLAFEMVAPFRDLLLFSPGELHDDPNLWAKYTKVFDDCGIKVSVTKINI